MSAYNIVVDVPSTCPRCNAEARIVIQFKFGATWQYQYAVGDTIRWGKNDNGSAGSKSVVADGAADAPCVSCGFDGDWDFYVFFEHDRLVGVASADGRFDFTNAGKTYIELG